MDNRNVIVLYKRLINESVGGGSRISKSVGEGSRINRSESRKPILSLITIFKERIRFNKL